MTWSQVYDPLGSLLSTLVAALPVVVLLGALGVLPAASAHGRARSGLRSRSPVAMFVFGMPAAMAGKAALYGAAVRPAADRLDRPQRHLPVPAHRGARAVRGAAGQHQRTSPTTARLQLLLIAFCFGAFFEGAAGFGTPVAVTGAILIGLGFTPLAASGLSLIANTAPVAFGALGTPIIALAAVTGLDLLRRCSAMVGRQLPFFSLHRAVLADLGVRRLARDARDLAGHPGRRRVASRSRSSWSRTTTARGWSTSIAAIVLDGVAGAVPRVWQSGDDLAPRPRRRAGRVGSRRRATQAPPPPPRHSRATAACGPGCRGDPQRARVRLGPAAGQGFAQRTSRVCKFPIAGLAQPGRSTCRRSSPKPTPEAARLRAQLAVGDRHRHPASPRSSPACVMGCSVARAGRDVPGARCMRVRYSLLTIAAMLALGFTTRYSGLDATLGLAFAHTGVLYPFFGTMLGWLGVALTGSDTSSNVLFGSLQRITAEQLGLSPVLMAAANSSGGVMGKMIDAQSIVVAATATQ